MKIGFCFAGQGAQAIGMGKDLYDEIDTVRKIYDAFPEIRDLCFKDENGVLNQTAYAQPAMLLTGYAIAKALEEKGITPEYSCGLSLGEYTALASAGAWDIKDAIEIITNRGRIMQNALPLGTTKMAAIIGLDRETIANVIKDIDGVVEIANYNCPGQIVITGENKAIDEACVKLKEAKARRALPLNVSGAFHSSLLTEASHELRAVLDRFEPKPMSVKMIYNITGKEETMPLNDILERQICHSVYFEDSVRYMMEKGVDTFIEVGPGKTLSGFIHKINAEATVYNVSDLQGYKDLLEKING